jgi:hypothetical protein
MDQWQCGACGGIHGWECPYFGGPGRFNPPPCSREEGERQRAADLAAMVGPFRHLRSEEPNP